MSQTKQWFANLSNTTRNPTTSSSGNQGSGGNQRMYAGRDGSYDYDFFLRYALDWTNVGRIVSAVLNVYTDDGLGNFDATTTETPTVWFERLTSAFSEGSNSSGFTSADYTAPSQTTSGVKKKVMNRAVFGLTTIDITDFVELWAPKSVKRRNGSAGGAVANYGIGGFGLSDTKLNWAGWSDDYTDPTYRPTITLTYEYGVTVPDTPTNLAPSGSVAAFTEFSGDFSDPRTTDQLRYSEVEVYTSAATNAGQVVTLNGGSKVYSKKLAASQTEIDADHFLHDPVGTTFRANTTYKWRVRVYDQEGQISPWTNLTSFVSLDTAPNPPTTTPAAAASFATLDGVLFRGTFSDPDAGNTLSAYQVQMSAYGSGDPHWDDDQYILWNTGKVYVPVASTTFSTPYGGDSLNAGTYYWRARTWDNKAQSSDWTYHSIVLTADFVADPGDTPTAIQLRPKAPWRIVIKDMYQSDGVTRTTGRGPGRTVAVIEDAKNVGASILFNSPGELHFTLGKAHPQLSVIEPKQTHYSVQFRSGDGWREVFAGLMWDFDATDTDIVFYGIDYLGLLDYTLDERYDQSNPDKPSEKGGSKYVTAGKNTIAYIVGDQIDRARNLPNSPVGFITKGAIATMTETLTVFSTYSPTLSFITGLLDSHRAGQGKKTRISVRPKTAGGYEFVVQDDPGQVRDNLRLRYGELVQGYRVIPFGTEWASRISAIGRAKDGIQVLYKTATAPGIDEATWGRFTQVRLIDGVSDANDLQRRTNQAAIHAGKLGKSIALGIRTGFLQPRDGYDVCDLFPVDIVDGSVDTGNFGSGYWAAMGITWTAAAATGKQEVTLTLQPKEDGVAPSSDLLTLQPISPQAEWQIGWTAPNPLLATSKYWLDQTTGIVYIRTDGILVVDTILTGTA